MDIRDLTPDDGDAILDLRTRAFGPLSGGDVAAWRTMVAPSFAERRYLGVVDGSRLVAAARINDYDQWWHGRRVPMGGVAGVTVAPEDRGRGVGRLLMEAVLERCGVLGYPVSALYPATTPIYRSLGWEHVGAQLQATLPAESLRGLSRGGEQVKLRRAGVDDAAEVVEVVDRVYERTRPSGPLRWSERDWRLWLAEEEDFAYLAEDGFLLYRWDGKDLDVDNLVASSAATAQALWGLLGSAASIAKRVTACVEPDDPVFWLLRERTHDEVRQTRWMLRLVDVPAAVAARGFPASVSADLNLAVDDPRRPANTGVWRLRVASGRGTLTPGDGPVAGRLTVGGMSALYGGVGTATLRRAGLLTGGDGAADDVLDGVFAAKPYMIDYF
ncbi:GNAT family N-acetyltransferase [Rhizohabitans arisaemae]|uniref:GNAT family N-acetyltransferase n=1 Tax=Rhizohabitans arisaemae TaxID=2720610 RepID=UPI0024B214A4|nr:GNAT family N-acetyltransferase [Rhizohabitans arisaemae]